ncbi:MAG: glycosyltransferase family 2 protein [Thermoleophilaceae bacterium]|nr:glycosyltransferase family 2 protein [Thermoleophilaceae bacterium]
MKDRRERMLRCLEDLLALDYPSYDVVVLDNLSRDGTPEGSVGHLRNRGAALARGPTVAYTDSDCSPHAWLAEGRRGAVCESRRRNGPGAQRADARRRGERLGDDERDHRAAALDRARHRAAGEICYQVAHNTGTGYYGVGLTFHMRRLQ